VKHAQQVKDLARRLGVSESVLLEHYFERAAIRHYDGGMERDDADRAAADDIVSIYGGGQ
jgi:hypothetical protein